MGDTTTRTVVVGTWQYDENGVPTVEPYPAVVDDHWNGWACPRFDLETARRVVADQMALHAADPEGFPDEITEDVIGDGTVVFVIAESGHRDEVLPDKDGLYGIGSYGWCWEEAPVVVPDLSAFPLRVRHVDTGDVGTMYVAEMPDGQLSVRTEIDDGGGQLGNVMSREVFKGLWDEWEVVR